MKKMMLAVASLAFVVFSGVASAGDTPPSLQGAVVVSAAQVKELHSKGVPIFDARVPLEYAEGHIPGAVNVPYFEHSGKNVNYDASKDRVALKKLPADKNAELVVYCNGPECWKSYKESEAAIKAGYSKVHWFRGGFPEWKAANYPVAQ